MLRPARLEDLPALPGIEVAAGQVFAEIGLHAIAEDDPPDAAELVPYVDAGRAWVVEEDGELVGYAVASVVDGEGHLDQVSVLPSARGRGLGRALVDAVCAWAQRSGHSAVTLTTFAAVPWNGPYYQRLGFRPVPDTSMGPELADVRRRETERGLDVRPRIAMRRPAGPLSS